MSLFNSILSQIQEKISKESVEHEKIAQIISHTLRTTITAEQIMVRDATLRLKVAPTIKMTLLLQREKLLTALQDAGIKITTIQ
jgi:hypothetical protein